MSFGFATIGCTCTIPHKEYIAQCCDEVDPVAKVGYIVNNIESTIHMLIMVNDRSMVFKCNLLFVVSKSQ